MKTKRDILNFDEHYFLQNSAGHSESTVGYSLPFDCSLAVVLLLVPRLITVPQQKNQVCTAIYS